MGNQTLPHRPIDKLIEGLCATCADLRERCRALEQLAVSRGQDASGYERLSKQALSALHREQQAHEKLRARYDRLVAEYREHRERTMQSMDRAA